jgi:hypothetical protein
MAAGSDWSRAEVEATVSAYLEMLRLELQRVDFNKAERNRAVQSVTGRSRTAIEFKHQNISAVLRNLNFPWVDGYKPMGNFQALLAGVVEEVIVNDSIVNALAEGAVERNDFEQTVPPDLLPMLVAAPAENPERSARVQDGPERTPMPGRRDYIEREARNSALGTAGELLVLQYEHRRLWTAGKRRLADRIDHVASTRGDHLGYDIRSFDESGRERFVEVKTTQFGRMTPFFATRNEVEVSKNEADRYQVYRVFSYAKNPRLFVLPGPMAQTCTLLPTIYRASVKGIEER